jgi:hypothetical protein
LSIDKKGSTTLKEIKLPPPTMISEKEHTAAELIEDLVMVRQAWRAGDGPKHADIVFVALDKLGEAASSGVFRLPDKTYNFLLEQMALDPSTSISPRSANRFYLRIVRAMNDAAEVEESS